MLKGFRVKLLGGFGAMCILLAVVGWVGWRATLTTASAVTGLLESEFTQLAQLNRTSAALYELRGGVLSDGYASADAAQRVILQSADTRWLASIDDDMQRYAASDLTVDEHRLLTAWQQAYALFVTSRQQLRTLNDQGALDAKDMRTVTGSIQEGANGLSSASTEILAAVAQQSSGASERTAAITQTTATVSQVKASADEAVQMAIVVSDTAREASRVAGQGVQAASAAAAGMADLREKVESIAENILALSEQSQRIGEIIATVNDLADQSNLLALNAAIEASRAGEQGRGFAVVATEIRNLAEQSRAATAQIRTILGDVQRATNATVLSTEQGTRGVDTGMQLVEQTGQTIGELAHVIDQASDSAHQIAASVRQHSVGMEQVAAAMLNINQATTHSLTATADTRKAAEHLTTLAVGLTRTVAHYKV